MKKIINTYPGKCAYCLTPVAARRGCSKRLSEGWFNVCQRCAGSGAAAFRSVAASITPGTMSRYLTASPSWQLEMRRTGISASWVLNEPGRPLPGRPLLPLASHYPDFCWRFPLALSVLGRINGWDPSELEKRVREGKPPPQRTVQSRRTA